MPYNEKAVYCSGKKNWKREEERKKFSLYTFTLFSVNLIYGPILYRLSSDTFIILDVASGKSGGKEE